MARYLFWLDVVVAVESVAFVAFVIWAFATRGG